MDNCYNAETSKYDDTMCTRPTERCGAITKATEVVAGCIGYQFCGTTGKYLDETVPFECLSEEPKVILGPAKEYISSEACEHNAE